MAQMLMGAFESPRQADRAIRDLEERGYRPEEISAIAGSNRYEEAAGDGEGHEVARAATSGAVTGGVIGGLAGILASVGVIPAVAGLFIGGPIVAAIGLAGAAALTASGVITGAAAGGLIGALMGLGVPKEQAESYDRIVKQGGLVIGLSGHEDITSEARVIMERYGAQDVHVVNVREDAALAHDTAPMDARREAGVRAESRPINAQQPAFGERREDMVEPDRREPL